MSHGNLASMGTGTAQVRAPVPTWSNCGHCNRSAIPVDNNASERALRTFALGRKKGLFVGNAVAGEHLAVLMSLVRSCEAAAVNPKAYIADVLMRVQTHPMARIDELLPDVWAPTAEAATVESG
ncbi:MAG: transposase [Myxococcales bacterium]|nr:transposase [Myxococcales bacterium]